MVVSCFLDFRASSPGQDLRRSDPGPPTSPLVTGTPPLTPWLCFETGESNFSFQSGRPTRGAPSMLRRCPGGTMDSLSQPLALALASCRLLPDRHSVLLSSQLLQLHKSGRRCGPQRHPPTTAPGEGGAPVPITTKHLPATRRSGPERGRQLKALQKKGPSGVSSTRGPLPSGLSPCQSTTVTS